MVLFCTPESANSAGNKLTISSTPADLIKRDVSDAEPMSGEEKKPTHCNGGRWWWLIALLPVTLLAGCPDTTIEPPVPPVAPAATVVAGYAILVFESPEAQFNYAKSLFADPREKAAALNLIFSRFPHDRRHQGEARLELAYLHLGNDFRLVNADACARALAAYESIAREFADLPAVRSKAYWYMAWIYTDLLNDKPKGLALYSLLAEKYPQDRFSRIYPVPWLKLVFPDPEVRPYTADDEHTHSWAGLALLEIVRHAEDPSMRRQALEKLWAEHRRSLTTGYALKAVLDSPIEFPHLSDRVAEYVTGNTVNSELNRDLEAGIARRSTRERKDQ